jgi:uncharacterized protein YdgA (DUF945 family)
VCALRQAPQCQDLLSIRYTSRQGIGRWLAVNTKTIKTVVIVLVVLVLAYPGLAWLIGLQVEASMLKREQQALDAYPGAITLVSRHYQRGVYGATEVLTYGLGTAITRALAPLAGTSDVAGMHMVVRNTIHHGPLPQFRTMALATFTTQVELPPQLSAKIRALLGGEPTFQIRGRLGWLGGATTVMTSPGYEVHLADGDRLSWHELDVRSSTNADLSSMSVAGKLAGFDVNSTKLQVQLQGLHVNADWKKAFGGLYTGPFSLKIDTVKWQPQPPSNPGSIQGLSIGGAGSVEGDYYTSAVQFGADALQVSEYSITHAVYAISFEHLHGPTLAKITKEARETRVGANLTDPQPRAAALDQIKKDAMELLVHDPVMNISQLAFSMPEGALRLSAKVSAPGLTREDLDGPQLQPALLQHLNVVADLRIDTGLLTRLLASNPRKDTMAAQIDALQQQGYIKRDGAALTAHVTVTGTKIAINGRPYPPRPGT